MSLSVILSSSHVSTKHIKSGLLISQHKIKSSNFRTKLRQLKYRIEKHLLEESCYKLGLQFKMLITGN